MDHKKTFQDNPISKGWTDVVDGAQFQLAANAAMLHFHDMIQPHSDMASAAASEWRRQGALQFLNILMGLNINHPRAPLPTGKTLDHTV